jgi:hypothetical protein
MHAN